MILPERVFGRPGVNWITSGLAMGLISLPTHASIRCSARRSARTDFQRDKSIDALTFDIMRIAHDGGFGDLVFANERTFDFRGTEAMTGDVDHIIDPAGDPVIAILIAAAAIAGEIFAAIGLEIGVDEALMIAIDLRIWPGQLSRSTRLPLAAPSRTLPSASTSCGWMPNSGFVAEPGLRSVAPGRGEIRMPPVSVCHHVSTMGQRLSPTSC